jgi:hypothetical protein
MKERTEYVAQDKNSKWLAETFTKGPNLLSIDSPSPPGISSLRSGLACWSEQFL